MAAKLELVPPGKILREEFMDPLSISAYRLAKDLDVPQDRISAILRGTRAITLDTAIRLGRYFGTTHQFWLNLQSEYEFRLVRRSGALKEIEARVPVLASQTAG